MAMQRDVKKTYDGERMRGDRRERIERKREEIENKVVNLYLGKRIRNTEIALKPCNKVMKTDSLNLGSETFWK